MCISWSVHSTCYFSQLTKVLGSVTISINWKCTWSLDYRNGNYWVWEKWQDPMVWVFVISWEELIAFTLKIWPPGMVPQCLIDLVFPWSLLFMLFLWKQKQQLLLSLLWEQPKPQQDTPEPVTVSDWGRIDRQSRSESSTENHLMLHLCLFLTWEKSETLCNIPIPKSVYSHGAFYKLSGLSLFQ